MPAVNPCSGRPWQRATAPFRRWCAANGLPCALCKRPIDYSLPGTHRWGFTVDHIHARWAGGAPMDPSNWQPTHRSCNSSRGASEGNRNRGNTPPRHTSLTW